MSLNSSLALLQVASLNLRPEITCSSVILWRGYAHEIHQLSLPRLGKGANKMGIKPNPGDISYKIVLWTGFTT